MRRDYAAPFVEIPQHHTPYGSFSPISRWTAVPPFLSRAVLGWERRRIPRYSAISSTRQRRQQHRHDADWKGTPRATQCLLRLAALRKYSRALDFYTTIFEFCSVPLYDSYRPFLNRGKAQILARISTTLQHGFEQTSIAWLPVSRSRRFQTILQVSWHRNPKSH